MLSRVLRYEMTILEKKKKFPIPEKKSSQANWLHPSNAPPFLMTAFIESDFEITKKKGERKQKKKKKKKKNFPSTK